MRPSLHTENSFHSLAQANKQKMREKKRNEKANGVVRSPLKPHDKTSNKKWLKKQEQKKRFAEKEKNEKASASATPLCVKDVEMVDSKKIEKKEVARLNKKAKKGSKMQE